MNNLGDGFKGSLIATIFVIIIIIIGIIFH
jgi:hypothetical protein